MKEIILILLFPALGLVFSDSALITDPKTPPTTAMIIPKIR